MRRAGEQEKIQGGRRPEDLQAAEATTRAQETSVESSRQAAPMMGSASESLISTALQQTGELQGQPLTSQVQLADFPTGRPQASIIQLPPATTERLRENALKALRENVTADALTQAKSNLQNPLMLDDFVLLLGEDEENNRYLQFIADSDKSHLPVESNATSVARYLDQLVTQRLVPSDKQLLLNKVRDYLHTTPELFNNQDMTAWGEIADKLASLQQQGVNTEQTLDAVAAMVVESTTPPTMTAVSQLFQSLATHPGNNRCKQAVGKLVTYIQQTPKETLSSFSKEEKQQVLALLDQSKTKESKAARKRLASVKPKPPVMPSTSAQAAQSSSQTRRQPSAVSPTAPTHDQQPPQVQQKPPGSPPVSAQSAGASVSASAQATAQVASLNYANFPVGRPPASIVQLDPTQAERARRFISSAHTKNVLTEDLIQAKSDLQQPLTTEQFVSLLGRNEQGVQYLKFIADSDKSDLPIEGNATSVAKYLDQLVTQSLDANNKQQLLNKVRDYLHLQPSWFDKKDMAAWGEIADKLDRLQQQGVNAEQTLDAVAAMVIRSKQPPTMTAVSQLLQGFSKHPGNKRSVQAMEKLAAYLKETPKGTLSTLSREEHQQSLAILGKFKLKGFKEAKKALANVKPKPQETKAPTPTRDQLPVQGQQAPSGPPPEAARVATPPPAVAAAPEAAAHRLSDEAVAKLRQALMDVSAGQLTRARIQLQTAVTTNDLTGLVRNLEEQKYLKFISPTDMQTADIAGSSNIGAIATFLEKLGPSGINVPIEQKQVLVDLATDHLQALPDFFNAGELEHWAHTATHLAAIQAKHPAINTDPALATVATKVAQGEGTLNMATAYQLLTSLPVGEHTQPAAKRIVDYINSEQDAKVLLDSLPPEHPGQATAQVTDRLFAWREQTTDEAFGKVLLTLLNNDPAIPTGEELIMPAVEDVVDAAPAAGGSVSPPQPAQESQVAASSSTPQQPALSTQPVQQSEGLHASVYTKPLATVRRNIDQANRQIGRSTVDANKARLPRIESREDLLSLLKEHQGTQYFAFIDLVKARGDYTNAESLASFLGHLGPGGIELDTAHLQTIADLTADYLQALPEYFDQNDIDIWAQIADEFRGIKRHNASVNTELALDAIAAMVVTTGAVPNTKQMTDLLQAFSDCPENRRCLQAATKLARYVRDASEEMIASLSPNEHRQLHQALNRWKVQKDDVAVFDHALSKLQPARVPQPDVAPAGPAPAAVPAAAPAEAYQPYVVPENMLSSDQLDAVHSDLKHIEMYTSKLDAESPRNEAVLLSVIGEYEGKGFLKFITSSEELLEDKSYNNTNSIKEFINKIVDYRKRLNPAEIEMAVDLVTHYLQLKPELFDTDDLTAWTEITQALEVAKENTPGINTEYAQEAIARRMLKEKDNLTKTQARKLAAAFNRYTNNPALTQAAEKLLAPKTPRAKTKPSPSHGRSSPKKPPRVTSQSAATTERQQREARLSGSKKPARTTRRQSVHRTVEERGQLARQARPIAEVKPGQKGPFRVIGPTQQSIYQPPEIALDSQQLHRHQQGIGVNTIENAIKKLDTQHPIAEDLLKMMGADKTPKRYELAFVSTDPHQGEENTKRLTQFVLKIRQSKLTREQKQHAIDVVAHYIQLQPNYFQRDKSIMWSRMANNIKALMEDRDLRLNTRAIMEGIAQMVLRMGTRPNAEFMHLLVNGLSKHAAIPQCQEAAEKMARFIAKSDLSILKPEHLSSLTNSFSKWSASSDCGDAVENIANRFNAHARANERARVKTKQSYDAVTIANMINGFSKWPARAACQESTDRLARQLLSMSHEDILSTFEPIQISSIVNGLSKFDSEVTKNTLLKIANTIKTHIDEDALKKYGFDALAMLVNGFSKWPQEADAEAASAKLARHIKNNAGLLRSDNQDKIAVLVGGLIKFSDRACEQVIKVIAGKIANTVPLSLPSFKTAATYIQAFSQLSGDKNCENAALAVTQYMNEKGIPRDATDVQLAMTADGLSKFKGESFTIGTELLAEAVGQRDLNDIQTSALATLVHTFANHPDSEECTDTMTGVANYINTIPDGTLKNYKLQNIGFLIFGLGKVNEEAAVKKLITAFNNSTSPLSVDKTEALSKIALAVALRPEERHCQQAASKLAHFVNSTQDISNFGNIDLSFLSKCFDTHKQQANPAQAGTYQQALDKLTEQIGHRDITAFPKDALLNLSHIFTGQPSGSGTQGAIEQLLDFIANKENIGTLAGYGIGSLYSLANDVSKWPESQQVKDATVNLAQATIGTIEGDRRVLLRANKSHLALLANAFAKHRQEPACKQAIEAIGQSIIAGADIDAIAPKDLSLLANAFSSYQNSDICMEAILRIAETVNDKLQAQGAEAGQFNTQDLSLLVKSYGKFSNTEDREILQAASTAVAGHLAQDQQQLATAEPLSVAMMLMGITKHELRRQGTALAQPFADRIAAFAQDKTVLQKEVNLECAGQLCAGITKLGHSPSLQHSLMAMQPTIAAKVSAFLQSQQGVEITGADTQAAGDYSTNTSAASLFQIITSYEKLLAQPNLSQENRETIETWLNGITASAQTEISNDENEESWAAIAEQEATDGSIEDKSRLAQADFMDALEAFARKHPRLSANIKATTRMNPAQFFTHLNHEPDAPDIAGTRVNIPFVDIRGKRVSAEKLADHQQHYGNRYSPLARFLGEGQAFDNLVRVQLPGDANPVLLKRKPKVGNNLFRFDLFGGSAMKTKSPTLEDALKYGFQGEDTLPQYGSLFGLKIADTQENAEFTELLRKLMPNKESFYYFQRMLLPGVPTVDLPPGVGEGKVGHVLEGRFPIKFIADQTSRANFQLRNGVRLIPQDGHGFIKKSVAEKMLMVQHAGPEQQYGKGPTSNLPPQALQHYPADAEVARELFDHGNPIIPGESPDVDIFRRMTTGRVQGNIAVAVPSADGKVYIPTQKWEADQPEEGQHGVLLGKSPYDKANLRPMDEGHVVHDETDATVKFLSECTTIQYSYLGQDHSADQQDKADKDKPLFFAKGLMTVIDDADWPEGMDDQNVIMSTEDMKTHSDWADDKNRQEKTIDSRGILVATNIFGPGSTVAVPTSEQKKLDGDYDGDPLLILPQAKYPKFYNLVQETDHGVGLQNARYGLGSVKPKKDHSPATRVEDGTYEHSRSDQISAVNMGLMGSYSNMQTAFLSKPLQGQRDLASRIMHDINQRRELQEGLAEFGFSNEEFKRNKPEWLKRLLSLGIKVGTDAFKSAGSVPMMVEIREIIDNHMRPFNPYGKAVARKMGSGVLNIDGINQELERNTTLAGSSMHYAMNRMDREGLLTKYKAVLEERMARRNQ